MVNVGSQTVLVTVHTNRRASLGLRHTAQDMNVGFRQGLLIQGDVL